MASCNFEIRVRVNGCDEARVLGPEGEGGHVKVVFDNGDKQAIEREKVDIISEDLSAGMRVKSKEDSSDGGKWYKADEEGEVKGRSKMGDERVEVTFANNPKPQQPPRRRLDVLPAFPLRVPGRGMKRVSLIRHGRAQHNDDMRNQNNYPDAKLTLLGLKQAAAWAAAWANGLLSFAAIVGQLDLILVSPLQRTVQTACHMFANTGIRMQLCLPAREMYWHQKFWGTPNLANTPITVHDPTKFEEFLNGKEKFGEGMDIEEFDSCPEGKEKLDASTMIRAPQWEREAKCEEESVQHLLHILATHPANTIAVVTHGGVIKALTGVEAENCTIVECVLFEHWQSPKLKPIAIHATPHREVAA